MKYHVLNRANGRSRIFINFGESRGSGYWPSRRLLFETIMHANTVFQSPYGRLQPPYFWMCVGLGIVGLLLVPVGLLWNEGWKLGVRPMEPWAATVIIEILALGALSVAAYAVLVALKAGVAPRPFYHDPLGKA